MGERTEVTGNREHDGLDELRDAKREYDSACHRVSQAMSERDSAQKRLMAATERVQQKLAIVLDDPTIPQPVVGPMPAADHGGMQMSGSSSRRGW